jgi:hypothetical protein
MPGWNSTTLSRRPWLVFLATSAGIGSQLGCSAEMPVDRGGTVEGTSSLALNLEAEEASMHVGAINAGQGPVARSEADLRGTSWQLSREEMMELGAAKEERSSELSAGVDDWRAHFRISAANEPEQKEVTILIALDDEKFPWHEFRNRALTEENMDELVRAREDQLRTRLDAIESRITALGGTNIVRFWIAPAISARVPARVVPVVAGWTDIQAASRDDNETRNFLASYRPGLEGREATRADTFIAAGYTGDDGHLGGSARVRAAVYDAEGLFYSHPGFQNAGGSLRIAEMRRCSNGSCPLFTPSNENSHAVATLGILGGSIEDGQDANYPLLTSRLRRSGIARSASLYYFTAPSTDLGTNFYAMLQSAMTLQLDVVNHSWNWGCVCSRTCDVGGANAVLRNSMDSGTLNVISAGNGGAASCTAAWPTTRPDALKVGALATTSSSQAYNSVSSMQWDVNGSSRGGMTVTSNGISLVGAHSLVDVAAPGCFDKVYLGPDYYPDGTLYLDESVEPLQPCASSFAAPLVAGNAALLLDSFYSLGFSGMDARMTQTYMIMMADGWNVDAGAIAITGMSTLSGAGRFKNHFSTDLTPPSAWGCHKDTFVCPGPTAIPCSGGVFSYGVAFAPTPASVTTWKAALTWKDSDLNNATRLTLRVRNTCPAQTIATDASNDIRKRIKLVQSFITGKCLVYDVIATHIPAFASRTFTVCDYLQSGNPADH